MKFRNNSTLVSWPKITKETRSESIRKHQCQLRQSSLRSLEWLNPKRRRSCFNSSKRELKWENWPCKPTSLNSSKVCTDLTRYWVWLKIWLSPSGRKIPAFSFARCSLTLNQRRSWIFRKSPFAIRTTFTTTPTQKRPGWYTSQCKTYWSDCVISSSAMSMKVPF